MALTYAMSPRGACHVADPMLFVEMGARYYPEIGFDYITGNEPRSDENNRKQPLFPLFSGPSKTVPAGAPLRMP